VLWRVHENYLFSFFLSFWHDHGTAQRSSFTLQSPPWWPGLVLESWE
jgi:hypothetical protein